MTASSLDMNKQKGISISSLLQAFACSRQYYFNKNAKWKSSDTYTICKQVSCACNIHSEEEIWDAICLIHPEISPDSRDFLSSCITAMKHAPVRPWTDTDITVKSKKVGLYGLLDKYDANTGECTLTRCCTAPKTGCWPEDAIRTAALLLCVKETCSLIKAGMYIEYIPSGVIRYYEPNPKDRRRIVQTIHQIHEIDKGAFPPKPLHPPCSRCRFVEKCSGHEPRKLSALFKK